MASTKQPVHIITQNWETQRGEMRLQHPYALRGTEGSESSISAGVINYTQALFLFLNKIFS